MYVYVCALQSQGFDELLAKLNAAVQVLQNSEVQLGTDVTEQVQNAATRLPLEEHVLICP
jgi:hypothetical protein